MRCIESSECSDRIYSIHDFPLRARAGLDSIGDGGKKKSFMDREGKVTASTAYGAQTDRPCRGLQCTAMRACESRTPPLRLTGGQSAGRV
jgi:hypothetical protein